MALVLKEKDANGNAGVVRGKFGSLHGLGGYPIPGVPTLAFACVLVDLELSVYETGGICLLGPERCISFSAIYDMCVLGAGDPYNCGPADPPCGLTFKLDTEDPCNPKLIICDADGEVADGFTLPGGCVWLRLGGLM